MKRTREEWEAAVSDAVQECDWDQAIKVLNQSSVFAGEEDRLAIQQMKLTMLDLKLASVASDEEKIKVLDLKLDLVASDEEKIKVLDRKLASVTSDAKRIEALHQKLTALRNMVPSDATHNTKVETIAELMPHSTPEVQEKLQEESERATAALNRGQSSKGAVASVDAAATHSGAAAGDIITELRKQSKLLEEMHEWMASSIETSKPASDARTEDWQKFAFAASLQIPSLSTELAALYKSVLRSSEVQSSYRAAVREKPDMHAATDLFLKQCLVLRARESPALLKFSMEVGFHSSEYRLHGYIDKAACNVSSQTAPEESRPQAAFVKNYRCPVLIFMSLEEKFISSVSERAKTADWKQSSAQLGASMSGHVEAALHVHNVHLPFMPGILLVQEADVMEEGPEAETAAKKKRRTEAHPGLPDTEKQDLGQDPEYSPLRLQARCYLFTPNPDRNCPRWSESRLLATEEEVCDGVDWCLRKAEELAKTCDQLLCEGASGVQHGSPRGSEPAGEEGCDLGRERADGKEGCAVQGQVQEQAAGPNSSSLWWTSRHAQRLGGAQVRAKALLSGPGMNEGAISGWVQTGFFGF